uniref:Uncharacterized protein n=1 Tax=Chromera velia CCMP2878 TaxID=1169474 RepID=A0A0G4FYP2_9ALVE|eukprot:Cvel_19293.t1-p1 / transcript=Cvel_19293.t1 / gene=Cvel_19293 / organism=Chromera_velia_CCMP2878 / gene_product=hypothetical protein / transcript_product=hypothetical protein / location=Cvel_scaffold1652:6480-9898(+) / protein_length=272 / sequence_SO=supercontig / SO=protein_coding / is_pseudo=false
MRAMRWTVGGELPVRREVTEEDEDDEENRPLTVPPSNRAGRKDKEDEGPTPGRELCNTTLETPMGTMRIEKRLVRRSAGGGKGKSFNAIVLGFTEKLPASMPELLSTDHSHPAVSFCNGRADGPHGVLWDLSDSIRRCLQRFDKLLSKMALHSREGCEGGDSWSCPKSSTLSTRPSMTSRSPSSICSKDVHSINFVIAIEVPTERPASYWIHADHACQMTSALVVAKQRCPFLFGWSGKMVMATRRVICGMGWVRRAKGEGVGGQKGKDCKL